MTTDLTNQQGESMGASYQRLSVNINDETAAILRDFMAAHGVTATEAVRRAIGCLGFFLDCERSGREVIKIDADGRERTVRLVR